MKALQAVGLGLILLLTGIVMAVSIALWPLGVAIGLAGLTLLIFGGLFGRMEGEAKIPSPPARQ
jgi:uncharacterized protein (DUF58 family)